MNDKIKQEALEFLDKYGKFVVVMGDNPDGDSVATALAIKHILSNAGKTVDIYCGIDVPRHLQVLPGWEVIMNELPENFEASIIVDTTALSLLEQLEKSGSMGWLRAKPSLVLDHHDMESTLDFATITYIDISAVSTSHVLFNLLMNNDTASEEVRALAAKFNLDKASAEYMISSMMSDTLGLATQNVKSNALRAVADLVDYGVSLNELEERRRETMRKDADILALKGRLIERINYACDGRLAYVIINDDEIKSFSDRFNPSILVLDEMRLVTGVEMAIAFKVYSYGRITGKIRANSTAPLASKLAEALGGGGHAYAAGFKVQGKDAKIEEVVQSCQKIFEDLKLTNI
jgi:bifunctional oligoribonuclease and PAP phosphatase NrnA